MQKIIVCVAQRQRIAKHAWNARLMHATQSLCENSELELFGLSLALADEDVAPAHLLEMKYTLHPNDAVVSMWVGNPYNLQSALSILAELGDLQSYMVAESNVLPIEQKQGRVSGMCQMAFLKRPDSLSKQDWLVHWLENHTKVAVETQSTFGYRQNIVVSPLPFGELNTPWPIMNAIVEENFPAIAMTCRESFFDSKGNPDQFESRQQEMMQSCFKFIDFEAFDCVPMSQYIIKPLPVSA